jgi:aminopeptidase YwaD
MTLKRTTFGLGVPLLLAVLLAACGSSQADPPPPTAAPVSTATAAGFTPSPTATPVPTATLRPSDGESPAELATRLADEAMEFLTSFTENMSPRASTTEQERSAAEFLADQFGALGYKTRLQSFTTEVSSASLTVGPEDTEIPSLEMTLSGLGQATGVLVSVGKALVNEIPTEGLAGYIALIERGDITFEEKINRVAEAGAVGAVVYNNRDGQFRGTLTRESSIPAVSVARDSGQVLLDLIAGAEVDATISVAREVRESQNVIAEKAGPAGDGSVVVLGGHYDTVPNVPGANDNGSGTATLVTIAREVAARTYPFTVRFIPFGSEELGLVGSRSYVDSLSLEERGSIIVMLNFDALGSGDVVGVLGDGDLAQSVMTYGQEEGIAVERRFTLGGSSSDHASFLDAGIPAVFFLADDFSRIHTAEDRLQFVQPELMGNSTALALGLLDILARR